MELEKLIILETEFSPSISFDAVNCELKISGASRPEDVGRFYATALDWLRKFESIKIENVAGKPVKAEFHFSYFNSASSKMILQLLEVIKRMSDAGVNTSVDWIYEEGDEQVKEDGEELSYALDLPFNYLAR